MMDFIRRLAERKSTVVVTWLLVCVMFAGVRAASSKLTALSALTTPLPTDIALATHDPGGTPVSNKVTFATLQNAFPPRDFIMGLTLGWVDNTHFSVSAGSAYVESLGYAITISAVSSQAIGGGASAIGYLYLKSDGTITDTTATPVAFATPAGTARSRTSATGERFLGWYLTDGSSHIWPFKMAELGIGRALYTYTNIDPAVDANFRALSAGAFTSYTSVSLAAFLPPNVCPLAYLTTQAYSTNTFTLVLSTDGSHSNADVIVGGIASQVGSAGSEGLRPIDTAGNQIYYKWVTSSSPAAYIDVGGCELVR